MNKVKTPEGPAQEVRPGPRPDGTSVLLEETMIAGMSRGRTVGLLERWVARGKITPLEYMAAARFYEDYALAGLGPRFAVSSLERVDKGHDSSDGLKQAKARQRIIRAERSMGRFHSAAVVNVGGYQMRLSECARRMDVTWERVDGLLRGGLIMLARHYA